MSDFATVADFLRPWLARDPTLNGAEALIIVTLVFADGKTYYDGRAEVVTIEPDVRFFDDEDMGYMRPYVAPGRGALTVKAVVHQRLDPSALPLPRAGPRVWRVRFSYGDRDVTVDASVVEDVPVNRWDPGGARWLTLRTPPADGWVITDAGRSTHAPVDR